MKKLVNVVEVEGEGLAALLGENVMVFCMVYIYSGKLAGVNKDDILLEDAKIVYETGELKAKTFKDAQSLPGPCYIRTASIESYCKSGRE
jgi:hypothetical protein